MLPQANGPAVAALAIALVACGQPSPSASQPAVLVNGGQLQFRCGAGHPFGADLFDVPANAEAEDSPWAEALRRFLARNTDPGFIPGHGWFLAGVDARNADYVAPDPGGIGFVEVNVANGPAGWKEDGYGSCRPAVVLNGLGTASWILDPKAPLPAAGDTQFGALVTEMACASGRSSEGRVAPPVILYEQDRILVIFGVLPLEGPQRCPGNPSTRIVVKLREPIGERRLFDGSFLPPHDPTMELQ